MEVKLRFKPNEPSAYFFQNVQGVVVQLNGNEHKMRNIDLTDPTKLCPTAFTSISNGGSISYLSASAYLFVLRRV